MSAKKRIKLENMLVQASESSTAVPDLKDESEFEDATESQEHQLKSEELEEHEAKSEPESEEHPATSKRSAYHKFLTRTRDFYKIAVGLWREHKGLDVRNLRPTHYVVEHFFMRYNPGVKDRRALWSYVYEERPGPGGRLQYKATLRAHSLRDREFEGDWLSTKRLAQDSAIKVFKADDDVQEIAEWLAPSQTRIRERLTLNKAERTAFKGEGIDANMVVNEFVQCVYAHFPSFGCRNAILDGNA